jgi:uncharacterized Zn finger protein
MTQAQAKQLARALEIAERDGLQVCGRGWTRDGRRVYCVPSRTETNRWHLVIVAGVRLVCDCTAGQHGRICAHRAAVRSRILEEREAWDAANCTGLDIYRGWK